MGQTIGARKRAARGWLFAAAWMLPGMAWMWSLTVPGYFAAVAVFAGFHAVAATVSPQGPWRVIGRPAAHTLAETLRLFFPFGGVPLATLPIGQSDGPLVGVVRVGGVVSVDVGGLPDRLRPRRPLAVRPGNGPQEGQADAR